MVRTKSSELRGALKKGGFVIDEIDPEAFEFYLNGKSLGGVNHDDHGWAGIDRAISLVRNIGKILQIPVLETASGYEDGCPNDDD